MGAARLPTDHPDAFLNAVGRRVRGARARCGMTRRELARASGVSERYLAQLEQGQGNISITLLRRVAIALATDLAELLPIENGHSTEQILIGDLVRGLSGPEQQAALELLRERFPAAGRAYRRVALVGLRGAGKTTLGRRLADHYRVPFVRLVAEIEELAGMQVSEIFSLSGPGGYRRLEERALIRRVRLDEPCVLEAGGSIVTDQRLLDLLLGSAFVIWLRASPEEHMRRVIAQGDLRPMADNDDAMSDLRRILAEREPYYARAHARLDTSGRGVEECAGALIAMAPPRLAAVTDARRSAPP
jgi:XRE family aerobic/anaerobic benzoate catabolism transcriptional regulator